MELPADVLVLTFVEHSAAHEAVLDAARSISLPVRTISETRSPYIDLPDSWESLIHRLPKKMRWNLRKSRRDMESKGALIYRHYASQAEAHQFMELVREIETQSWKQAAGTSITASELQQRFYDELIVHASVEGAFSGHALLLDGQPVAYILGLSNGDGVFLDLKESFDQSYAQFSPGNLLKQFALPYLISSGVRIYDFMGECEPYKMRWTDTTYNRITLAVYRRTLAGYVSYGRSLWRDLIQNDRVD
jgi:CelD/BcsL family acetyltransferase involved in cellulose biosynthesis